MKYIFVYSGKGGVGKSTVAANISYLLSEKGISCGLCDLDLHSPNIHLFFRNSKISRFMKIDETLTISPAIIENIEITSTGFFSAKKHSLKWNSDYEEGAVHQLLLNAKWQCDYLIIDLPPGLTEIHIELIKNIKNATIILVTAPHILSYEDCIRGYNFFKNFKYEKFVFVENMAKTKKSKLFKQYFEGEKEVHMVPFREEQNQYNEEGKIAIKHSKEIKKDFEPIMKGCIHE